MEAHSRPDPIRVENMAKANAGQLRTRLREILDLPDYVALSRVKSLLPDSAPHVPDWDSAAQLFLGSAALERALHPAPQDVPKEFRHFLEVYRTKNWKDVTETLNKIRKIQKSRP